MAAMVAPQHGGLWQRRSSQMMQMSPMGMPTMMPMSPVSEHPSAARQYPQSHPSQLPMSMLPPTTAPQHIIPFQGNAYGFDMTTNMGHYGVQQPFMAYSQPMSQPLQQTTSYPTAPTDLTVDIRSVREAHNALAAVSRSPSVKTEILSPVEQNHAFGQYNNYDHSTESSSSNEALGLAFSTDVDCLMRAIQAKNQDGSPEEMPMVCESKLDRVETLHMAPVNHPVKEQQIIQMRNKARKRYLCSIPGCNKSFYQKTHLEIHTRAHTGVKPFVSAIVCYIACHPLTSKQLCKEPSCGQRFSQLGNLKVHIA